MTTPPPRPENWRVRINRGLLWLVRHWLPVLTFLIGVYATLPIAAPLLLRAGVNGPASIIYNVYSLTCHQFAFRSVFLFGEQTFYPRDIAGTEYTPYENYAQANPDIVDAATPDDFSVPFIFSARDFRGDQQMGYKIAICARDISIYLALFAGTLIYNIPYVRRRLRPLPFLLFVFIGLGPIGLDGFSQLLSYPPFEWWPTRETAPFFRVSTGAVFGLALAWLAIPGIARSMYETRIAIETKLRNAGYQV